jgi:hypothetical protein
MINKIYMIYLITLLLFSVFSVFLPSFIYIKSFEKKFFINQFLVILIIINMLVSFEAVFVCGGKTIFLIYFFVFTFLLRKKIVVFKKIDPKYFLHNKNKILLSFFIIFPIYAIQLLYNFNFSASSPYLASDDIFFYSTISNQLNEFKQENISPILSYFYPKLFSGIQPYHYFDLWLNIIFQKLNGYSTVHNLIFVTYPFLLWILCIGLLAITELIDFKINYIIILMLMFLGPVYFSIYEKIFNDGNFFESAVFTITGFVKQTLPFSYFGQKHLPVYIYSALIIISLRINNMKLFMTGILIASISSIGIAPGLIFGAFIYILFYYKFNLLKILKLTYPWIIILFSFFIVIILFSTNISTEISSKTSYFSNQTTLNLNWKGEIVRLIQKLFFPLIWLTILYAPYLFFLIFINNLKFKHHKKTFIFLFSTYLGGTTITVLTTGLNSDQFATNLIPLYNCFIIYIIIYLLKNNLNFKGKLTMFFLIVLISSYNFIWNTNYSFASSLKRNTNEVYDLKTQRKLLFLFAKTKCNKFGYLLSETNLKNTPPIHQYTLLPAKFLMNNNYYNYVDLNFPFYKYPKSSSSDVFSPRNQMRFFIKENKLSVNKFNSIQLAFVIKHKINWILCSKNAILPEIFNNRIKLEIIDPISKEKYYLLNSR